MALIDVQVVLHMADGIPENFSTNTWHFDDGEDPANYPLIYDELVIFYRAITMQYSNLVAKDGHEMKMYKISDPEPRAPIYVDDWEFNAVPTGAPLPPEVASVLSYQAVAISGIPQARRRGRVYIGPLQKVVVETDGRLTNSFVTTLRNAAAALLLESTTNGSWLWSTHSKVLGTGSNVASGWVDNEPDTQRRRGREATIRNTF